MEEVTQLPTNDGHLGGGEVERKDGDVTAEMEDGGGTTAKVTKFDLIRRCGVVCLFVCFVCLFACLFVCMVQHLSKHILF